MIGITKILTGKATVSAAVRSEGAQHPHLLQFSTENRPVVVWNATDRCNLECEHCYLESSPEAAGGGQPRWCIERSPGSEQQYSETIVHCGGIAHCFTRWPRRPPLPRSGVAR